VLFGELQRGPQEVFIDAPQTDDAQSEGRGLEADILGGVSGFHVSQPDSPGAEFRCHPAKDGCENDGSGGIRDAVLPESRLRQPSTLAAQR
jgi:hypothetical protein